MTLLDVLIIGAGPVGLFAALNLTRQGVSVRIIGTVFIFIEGHLFSHDYQPTRLAYLPPDQLAEPAPGGRADGIQPRTLELFNGLGLASQLIQIGFVNYDFISYNNGVQSKRVKIVSEGQAEIEFDYVVLLGQQHLERVLIEELAKLGVKVERPVRIEDLEVTEENGDDQHVTAVLKNQESGDLEAVYAKYAIGCDGSHSWVRRRFGITFEGDTSKIGWGVIEGFIETSFNEEPQIRLLQSDCGSALYIPRENGLTRVYVQLSDQIDSREDRQKVTLEVILEQASRNFQPFSFKAKEIIWWTNYVVGKRVAEQFSYKDRVFLAGDACHSHSPTLAQGLSIGLVDALNLAWKLSLVLQSAARPFILSTYQIERKSIAEQVIQIDDKYAHYASMQIPKDSSPGYASSFNKELLYLWKKNIGFTTGLGVEYNPNLISVRDTSADEVPLDAFCPNIGVLAGQRAPDGPVIVEGQKSRLLRQMPLNKQFYVLVLAGNVANTREIMKMLDAYLETEEGFAKRFGVEGKEGRERLFEFLIVGIVADETQIDELKELKVAKEGGKVLVDDEGGVHKRYEVNVEKGAVVIIRPDSWIGVCVDLENFKALEVYFRGFLIES